MMGTLVFSNNETTEQFLAKFAELNVSLPVNLSEGDLGVVVDAQGRDVFTVDSGGRRPDDQVEQIAHWIVCAINTCGGFKATVVTHG